ncbi:MAG TPA: TonB-dependent receptor [Luteimonas sp.]|nr:TonB-dependent receptor [Luteimonas sp.]
MCLPPAAGRRGAARVLALAVALASTLPTFAAEPPSATTDLDPVVVHGERQPADTVPGLAQARARLDERAGGTTLVDGEQYRDGRVGNLADALGFAPGVFVQPRFGAEEARLSIRGSGLQRTFHGRGIVVLQDGVPLNLADGSFDFQSIEPLAARYIEVWRGANALEHGAATLGGAINLVSPTGKDAAPLGARITAGSFATRRAQLSAAGAGEHGDAYATVTRATQDGFREHARQDNRRLFANLGWRFDPRLDARLYLAEVDSRSQLPGSLTLDEALHAPWLAAPASVQQDQRRDYRLHRIAAKLAWAPQGGGEATLSLFRSDKSLHHPIFQVLEQESDDRGVDLRWRGEGRVGGRRMVLSAGASLVRGTLDDRRFVNLAGQPGAPTRHFDQSARNASAWFEWQAWLAPWWVLSLGAHSLSSTRRSRDLMRSGGRDESFDLHYHATSPKLGLRYVADDGLQVFANLSRSAEPPSFGELGGGAGTTPLDIQRATSAELGVRVRREAFTLDAVAYRARITGELLSLQDPNGDPLGTVNAGRTLHQGIELGAQWQPSEPWRLRLNYLRNDFRFDADPVYADHRIAGVPPQQWRLALCRGCGGRVHVEPSLEWVPQGADVDHANTLRAPGYAVLDLKLGGRLTPSLDWFADLRNLTDRKWIAGTGVIADARGSDARQFLPGTPRAIYLGVEWQGE